MLHLKFFGKEYCMNRIFFLAVILPAVLFIIAFIFISGYYISRKTTGIIVEKKTDNHVSTDTILTQQTKNIKQADKDAEPKIKVYMTGSVMHPGVVEINKGQIIEDAINAAGGAKPDADLENINLAYILNENVMIKIKSKKDPGSEVKRVQQTTATEDLDTMPEAGKGVNISRDSGGAVVNENVGQTEKNSKININKATLDELDQLNGVGMATAKKILDYREKSGPFKTIDDIKKVSGIGEAKFNGFKDMITVG